MRRISVLSVLVAALCALRLIPAPDPAAASRTQLAMLQPGPMILTNPSGTMDQLKTLGVGVVRVVVNWYLVAPNAASRSRPKTFNAADPNAYPASNWAPYDAIVRAGKADGITVDFTVGGGAPLWAQGPGIPKQNVSPLYAWQPKTYEYRAFMTAIGRRYSGTFKPKGSSSSLPRVSFWAIWNEPNFGKNLAPQATGRSQVAASASMYRGLLDAGWGGLAATGHSRDTIVIGSVAARGGSRPGDYGTTKPLVFLRALYCVDSRNRPLRGGAARAIGCPTNGPGTRSFRSKHPALFQSSGFADHPYPINLPPTRATANDPDYTEFSQIPRLERALDGVQRAYGSNKRFAVYVTEYGYITNPPNHSKQGNSHFVSPPTAASYINWAEYLSWRDPRIATTMQYLLIDPNPSVGVPEYGGFASGLMFFGAKPKPSYDAYRLPLYLPVTSASRNRSIEVWGGVRPAHFFSGTQSVAIQFQRGSKGGFTTLATVAIKDVRGYFDTKIVFPASGSVRISWTYPGGTMVSSRTVKVSVH